MRYMFCCEGACLGEGAVESTSPSASTSLSSLSATNSADLIFEDGGGAGVLLVEAGSVAFRWRWMVGAAGFLGALLAAGFFVKTLAALRFLGASTARRAGFTAADVANTRPWAEFGPLRKRAQAARTR